MKRSFTAVIISVFLVLSTGCAGTDSSQPAQDLSDDDMLCRAVR